MSATCNAFLALMPSPIRSCVFPVAPALTRTAKAWAPAFSVLPAPSRTSVTAPLVPAVLKAHTLFRRQVLEPQPALLVRSVAIPTLLD
jgi:hypothetical protein